MRASAIILESCKPKEKQGTAVQLEMPLIEYLQSIPMFNSASNEQFVEMERQCAVFEYAVSGGMRKEKRGV